MIEVTKKASARLLEIPEVCYSDECTALGEALDKASEVAMHWLKSDDENAGAKFREAMKLYREIEKRRRVMVNGYGNNGENNELF